MYYSMNHVQHTQNTSCEANEIREELVIKDVWIIYNSCDIYVGAMADFQDNIQAQIKFKLTPSDSI